MSRFNIRKTSNAIQLARNLDAPAQLVALLQVGSGQSTDELDNLVQLFPLTAGDDPDMSHVVSLIYDTLSGKNPPGAVKDPIAGLAYIFSRNIQYNAESRRHGINIIMRQNRSLTRVPERFIHALAKLKEELSSQNQVVNSTWDEIYDTLKVSVKEPRATGIAMPTTGMIWAAQRLAHSLPLTKLFGAEGNEFISALITVPVNLTFAWNTKLVLNTPEAMANLLAGWRALTFQELTNIYRFCSILDSDETHDYIVGACFMLTTCLVKANVTIGWMTKRVQALIQSYQRADNLMRSLTTANFEITRNLIKPDSRNMKESIGSLLFMYHAASSMDFKVLKWMIEQARGTNCAALQALSQLVTNVPLCTYTVWTDVLKLGNQLNVAIDAMVTIILNPFAALVSPVATTSTFADIAYISVSMLNKSGQEGGFVRADAAGRCYNSASVLNSYVAFLKDVSSSQGGDTFNLTNIAAAYKRSVSLPSNKDAYTVMLETEQYNVPIPNDMGSENQPGRAPTNTIYGAVTGKQFREASEFGNAREINMRSAIQDWKTEKDKAFEEICALFQRAVAQNVITINQDKNRVSSVDGILPLESDVNIINEKLMILERTPVTALKITDVIESKNVGPEELVDYVGLELQQKPFLMAEGIGSNL